MWIPYEWTWKFKTKQWVTFTRVLFSFKLSGYIWILRRKQIFKKNSRSSNFRLTWWTRTCRYHKYIHKSYVTWSQSYFWCVSTFSTNKKNMMSFVYSDQCVAFVCLINIHFFITNWLRYIFMMSRTTTMKSMMMLDEKMRHTKNLRPGVRKCDLNHVIYHGQFSCSWLFSFFLYWTPRGKLSKKNPGK